MAVNVLVRRNLPETFARMTGKNGKVCKLQKDCFEGNYSQLFAKKYSFYGVSPGNLRKHLTIFDYAVALSQLPIQLPASGERHNSSPSLSQRRTDGRQSRGKFLRIIFLRLVAVIRYPPSIIYYCSCRPPPP